MLKRLLLASMAAAVAAGVGFAAQPKAAVTVPIKNEPATSGKQMFVSYCAPCHGVDGRGHGPVALSLRTPPPDLTQFSRNNRGKYPAVHVISVLQFGAATPAHGTAGMPVWGPIFAKMNVSDPQVRMLRISNLSRYLESIQAK
jgi:mono/diheme cytochrome c family protein